MSRLRAYLSDVVGRVAYGHERVALKRNGKVAAVLISKQDLDTLERLEMAVDVHAYRDAKAKDDGRREGGVAHPSRRLPGDLRGS